MNTASKRTFFFGGTAYLGMPWNVDFRQLVIQGMELYGVNHGASRNNNITLDIFSIAEKMAAKKFNADDSIILSSGYLAAQLVVQNYYKSHQLIYAPETHPALWLGIPDAPQLKYSTWVEQTILQINSSDLPSLVISNSVNNLIPEIYDFNWLKRIDPHKKVIILVDDSHGIGITGEHGEGAYSRILNLPNVQKIVIASMAKALGVDAGLILGNAAIIEQFRTSPVYAGSSPPSPGLLYAFVNSADIYSNELKKLRMNLRFFTDLLNSESGLHFINDFPIFLLKDDIIATGLLKNGINISSFPYPDPNGKSLHRIVLNSIHQREDLEILANTIKKLVDIKN